jgi:K+ transporter
LRPATIIASQAVITGAFSLTRQAMHLGFLPRMEILFTSETNTGQIFLPSVNAVLLFGVMLLVLSFQTSESLATAYGISVTGAMVVTSIMMPSNSFASAGTGRSGLSDSRAAAAGRCWNCLPRRQPAEDP